MHLLALTMRSAQSNSEKRDSLAIDWNVFLSLVLPHTPWFAVPNSGNSDLVKKVQPTGIILTGGDSLGTYPERDKTEAELISWGIQNNIPILGVCRGAQMLNFYFDGKISELNNQKHVGTYHSLSWQINSFKDTYLDRFDKTVTIPTEVNSYHNQAIFQNDLATDCTALAINVEKTRTGYVSQQNTVEIFCHKTHKIVGIMWHPEREQKILNFDKHLFQYMFGEKNE